MPASTYETQAPPPPKTVRSCALTLSWEMLYFLKIGVSQQQAAKQRQSKQPVGNLDLFTIKIQFFDIKFYSNVLNFHKKYFFIFQQGSFFILNFSKFSRLFYLSQCSEHFLIIFEDFWLGLFVELSGTQNS